jgi:hypothetical protein
MKFHLAANKDFPDNRWESETGIWNIDIWNGGDEPYEGYERLKKCRWAIELCFNDPHLGSKGRYASWGLAGLFTLEQAKEVFTSLEKVLTIIPETTDAADINSLFLALNTEQYVRPNEDVWLPCLWTLERLVEILSTKTAPMA